MNDHVGSTVPTLARVGHRVRVPRPALLFSAVAGCDRIDGVAPGGADEDVVDGVLGEGHAAADATVADAPSSADVEEPVDAATYDATTPDATTSDADSADAMIGDADTTTPDAALPDSSDAAAPDASTPCTEPSPAPTVTSIGPNPLPTTPTGSVIKAVGTDFTPCTTIRIRGTSNFWFALATTFISPTEIEATWPRDGIRRPTWYRDNAFEVFTPAPGGGESAAVWLRSMPLPEIGVLDPAFAPAGSATMTLRVVAKDARPLFDTGVQVYFNSTQLGDAVMSCPYGPDLWCAVSVTVPASLLAVAGTAMVTVVNPTVTPSQPASFQIQ